MDLIMGMNSGSSFDGIDVILAETKISEDGFPEAPRFLSRNL
jgi:anhydro-N-acetylmuramic acid kinase